MVLCCGAKQARDINVPGRDAQGIYFAVDYLTSVTTTACWIPALRTASAVTAEGKQVLVIGGGDTGNDCVGTAIRQGCDERYPAGDDALPARCPRPRQSTGRSGRGC